MSQTSQSMQVEPMPQRNATLWALLHLIPIFGLVYVYLSLDDLDTASRKVANQTGQQRVNTISPVLGVIMMFIPIVNIYLLVRIHSDLNNIIAQTDQNIDKVWGGMGIVLALIFSWLFIPLILLIGQWFKWRGAMNQIARM